jgi:hypothetical protein
MIIFCLNGHLSHVCRMGGTKETAQTSLKPSVLLNVPISAALPAAAMHGHIGKGHYSTILLQEPAGLHKGDMRHTCDMWWVSGWVVSWSWEFLHRIGLSSLSAL